jgi:hypothetical protein
MREYLNLAKLKHLTDQERVALLEFISRLRERYGGCTYIGQALRLKGAR